MPVAKPDVAGILGISNVGGRQVALLGLVKMIEEGLPVATVYRVSAAVAPDDPNFKDRIVARATLTRRRKTQRLTRDESDLLARLARIWVMARDVWGEEQEARAFLFRPHPLLEGRRPIDLVLASEHGARLTEDTLGRLKYGSAA